MPKSSLRYVEMDDEDVLLDRVGGHARMETSVQTQPRPRNEDSSRDKTDHDGHDLSGLPPEIYHTVSIQQTSEAIKGPNNV